MHVRNPRVPGNWQFAEGNPIEDEQLELIRAEIGDDDWFESQGRPQASRALFEQVALADDFVEFLTLPAYDFLLDEVEGQATQD